MTTRITLDRAAVQHLLDRDPTFEIDVHKTTLGELGRRLFAKDAAKLIAQMEPELFAKVLRGMQEDADLSALVRHALEKSLVDRSGTWTDNLRLSDATRKVIDERVAAVTDRVTRDAVVKIEEVLTGLIKRKLAERLDAEDLDTRIERRVNLLIEQEIARRVKERVDQRLADLRAALA